LKEEKHITKQT